MEIKWIKVEIRAATATGAVWWMFIFNVTHTHMPLIDGGAVGRAMERTWLVGAAVWWRRRRRALAFFNVCAAQVKRTELAVSARSVSRCTMCTQCERAEHNFSAFHRLFRLLHSQKEDPRSRSFLVHVSTKL